MCSSKSEFIKNNPDHNIVIKIKEANDQRNREVFTALSEQIGRHLHAVEAVPELRKCNCIDCFCYIEELEYDLIFGVK